MDHLSYKTSHANKATAEKNWVLVDAKDQVLGRVASQVASIIRGKRKVNFTPNVDCGDHVVVINAEKVKMTGRKLTQRVLFTHSGYPGGQREHTPTQILSKHPERLIETAVKGMLPKGPLGYAMIKKLKIYAGSAHPHSAQQPKQLDI